MSQRLEGKIAVVAGASKGIGASIAKHLADEGATRTARPNRPARGYRAGRRLSCIG